MASKRWGTKYLTPGYEKLCISFINQSKHLHPISWFARSCDYNIDPVDVTLLIQSGITRIRVLLKTLSHWSGPVSMSLWGSEEECQLMLDKINVALKDRWNVGIHLVIRPSGDKDVISYYPINYLRNTAFFGSFTSHVLTIDADFVPMSGSYSRIKARLYPYTEPNKSQVAFVIPAFEFDKSSLDLLPATKEEVKRMYRNGILVQFSDRRCPQCHNPTDYKRLLQTQEMYSVSWKWPYEPYVVLPRDTMPLYDERFLARHLNKIIYSLELCGKGYEFAVLPDVFIIHVLHDRVDTVARNIRCMDDLGFITTLKLLELYKHVIDPEIIREIKDSKIVYA
ncbi:unnamed protein product [Owenia fusiformis]|uniref:Uncharacterized protein n=1 Tax=Owenia fusiformis TaxID=6347 RepID=A0A8S4NCG9_OWEFU|nr:unnamed protein product [Owenia fusiformis]